MINLSQTPSEVHKLVENDVVYVNGQELLVKLAPDDRIYFTTTNSRGLKDDSECHFDNYDEFYHHLRRTAAPNKALMARSEVEEILTSGGYYIG